MAAIPYTPPVNVVATTSDVTETKARDTTLVFYIDDSLLQLGSNGTPDLTNLVLSRKFAGKSNVIFQSKAPRNFISMNKFEWSEEYMLGATLEIPPKGEVVEASTRCVSIEPGQSCDWKGNAQNMPYPKTDNSMTKGSFGTRHQPPQWYNIVYCKANNAYVPIYLDLEVHHGVGTHQYTAENNYILSWEKHQHEEGSRAREWSDPFEFSIDPAERIKYLSWGPDPDEEEDSGPTTNSYWYDYGTTDPKGHKPREAAGTPIGKLAASLGDGVGIGHGTSISFRLGWTDEDQGISFRRKSLLACWDYIKDSADGHLVLSKYESDLDTVIHALARLNKGSSFGDLLPGSTDKRKIITYLRAIIDVISPDFAPTEVVWQDEETDSYEQGATTWQQNEHQRKIEGIGFVALATLIWEGLKSAGAAVDSVHSILKKLKEGFAGQNKEFTYSRIARSNGKIGEIEYHTVISGKGLKGAEIKDAQNLIVELCAKERQRGNNPPPAGDHSPTPDNVTAVPDRKTLILAESSDDGIP